VERRLTVEELCQSDELFFANSLMECLPVRQLDQRSYQPAPGLYTRKLLAAFHLLVEGERRT
jgi:branched-chain amino acid aminotransferase